MTYELINLTKRQSNIEFRCYILANISMQKQSTTKKKKQKQEPQRPHHSPRKKFLIGTCT